jgi:hypothetical protein
MLHAVSQPSDKIRLRRMAARLLPLATLLILTCFLTPTNADADLWGHLTFGRDIVRAGAVHHADPYSFTSDRVWVNHEWLAEVAMWTSYAAGGGVGLIVLKLSLAWFGGALLVGAWRRCDLAPIQRDALLSVVALGAWPVLATVRPQMFSLALFAALLAVLTRIRSGNMMVTLALPAIFAVWVNLHGGWIVGAGVLAIFTAFSIFDSTIAARDRAALVAAATASAAATMCNPYGVRMLAFLAETVRPDRADIIEWQPITDLPLVAAVLWLVPTLVVVAALVRNRRSVSPTSIAVCTLLAVASFRVARLISFYTLAVGFLIAPYVWARATAVKETVRGITSEWRLGVVSCVVIVSLSIGLFGRSLAMNGSWLPEPEAAAYVSSHRLQGRMLTWFDYGEYAIWHFWPAIRVSMDGRRETVFSDGLRAAHWRIYENAPDALDEIGGLNPDYAWFPANLAIVDRLEAAGWRTAFRGPRSTILCRPGLPIEGEVMTVADSRRPRAFPGP